MRVGDGGGAPRMAKNGVQIHLSTTGPGVQGVVLRMGVFLILLYGSEQNLG